MISEVVAVEVVKQCILVVPGMYVLRMASSHVSATDPRSVDFDPFGIFTERQREAKQFFCERQLNFSAFALRHGRLRAEVPCRGPRARP